MRTLTAWFFVKMFENKHVRVRERANTYIVIHWFMNSFVVNWIKIIGRKIVWIIFQLAGINNKMLKKEIIDKFKYSIWKFKKTAGSSLLHRLENWIFFHWNSIKVLRWVFFHHLMVEIWILSHPFVINDVFKIVSIFHNWFVTESIPASPNHANVHRRMAA